MAAQDAELKLKVSLDLGFFRQQLAGLGQAAAGYNMPINVKFDRSAITKELRNLERALGKKKINIELNLLGGLTKDQLERIQGRLEALSKTKKVEIPVSVKNGATGRDIQETIAGIKQRIAANQQVRQGDGKLRIATSIKPSITNADVSEFKKAVQQKLSGISVKVKAEVERGFSAGPTGAAGLFEYMRSEGLSGGNIPQATEVGRSERLKKALEDLTVKQLQALAKEQGIGGVSRLKKNPLIDKLVAELNQDIAENILGNIKNQLRDIGKSPLKGVLDTFARGLFNMLGMDPASMRQQMAQQMAQQRALPGLNFPATVPSRPVSIGPSGTGRALPPGAIPGALPGTAFGAQRYLPSALGEEMKRVLREAANAFLDSIRAGIRQVNVRDMGPAVSRQPLLQPSRIAGFLPGRPSQASALELNNILAGAVRAYLQAVARDIVKAPKTQISRQPLLGPGSQVAGLLPAAGGTTPINQMRFNAVRTGAILGQQQFMRAPSIPAPIGGGGGIMPPSGGRRGEAGGMGGFGRALGGVNLPGAGAIRELGQEFAFATQQVLLFGQAYKMLAFIQNFPAQVGAAVSQLQNFRNTLDAISPTAEEAASSNRLILDLVEKYNVPLQSARDGFTKLYASMAPAGFSGDQVRDLFTGITQAAATFGMSADKVDRVNYAFAQMASKGQVMSEELKGQLGDVLPGAMAIFAEAAGFKGPKAIQDFSAALEEGAYKGQAMVALLNNVGIVMKQEFGPGAEGAARTFQGVINRMQNSMTLLYESFEPVAVGFLNTVVVPLTDGIKQISDGFNAFFTGTAAQTAGGFGIAQELERLRPAFEGIAQNVTGLVAQFGQFARAALEVGKVLLQIAGNPFIGYLARVYLSVLTLTTAIQILNLRALVPMIANLARSTYAFIAFTAQCVRAGQAVQITGLILRTFFASTGVGLVLVGIGMLIEKFMSMNQALADTRAKALGAADAIRSMSKTEARAAEQSAQSAYKTIGAIAGRPGSKIQGSGNDRIVEISERELKQLQGIGAFQTARDPLTGRITARRSDILSLAPQAQRLQAQAAGQIRDLTFQEKQTQQQAVLAPIPPSEGDGKKKKGKELDVYNRSQLDFIQKQFELEKQSLDKRLQGELISQTQYDIALAELKLETEKLRIAEQYRLAVDKTNADNLSASDKALKLKDLEIIKNKELAIAEDDRNIAIGAARKKIIDPIINEIDNETLAIERQVMEAKNLAEGRLSLTAAQEAELSVKERYASLSQDERENAKGELDILRQIREQRLQNAEALRLQASLQEKVNETQGIGGGLRAGFFGQAAGVFERSMLESDGNVDYATQMANIETTAMQLRSVFEGLQSAISGVSGAFANMLTEGITSMITGTATAKEVFASFLQSVGQALSQAASQMIATYIAIGIAKMFAGLGGGGGNPAGSGGGISDILPGASKYMEGGGAALGASAGTFGAVTTGYANGGIVPGGFRAFANGGVVSGPTLGLVGEGKYNEAVVPLPDGRSIPVQLGGRSARDLMGNGAPGMPQAPSLSMKFETTKINGVEYVSREQLEQAMAETRRASIAGGAQRGMSMTLDKIKQSPSTRSSIGIR
jgi:tape measure domain-containing protein